MKPDKEALLVNGVRAGGRSILKEGDFFRVRVMETATTEGIVPASLPLNILYEDEDILVLNKPADMPVHPSIGNYTNTLANAAAFYFQERGEFCPFRCINRLDRDTSGALVLAKNALSAAILSAQMRNREIRRTYLAVVRGVTPPSGTISAPIGRVSDSVIQRQVDPEYGETAVTHYEDVYKRQLPACTCRQEFSCRDFEPYSVATQASIGSWFSLRKRLISYPSVVPANTMTLYIPVSSWCYHLTVYFFCLRVSDKYGCKHIHLCITKFSECHQMILFAFTSDIAYSSAYSVRRFVLHHQIAGFLKIIMTFFAGWIIKTNHKVCLRRTKKSGFDLFPVSYTHLL